MLVSGTDGVGTKLKIAQAVGKHDTIGITVTATRPHTYILFNVIPLLYKLCMLNIPHTI